MTLDLLLRVHRRTGDKSMLDAVTLTLDEMARGGIYDQIGGGIHRYSTDREWLVPHFEKMLYDQAMVSAVYLDAYQATGNEDDARTAADIFEYVLRDMRSPEGAFYSSQDADSDGYEGKYYIWTVEQVEDVLGKEEAKLFCAYYDVTERGNWFENRGHAPAGPKNILHVPKPPAEFARLHGMDEQSLRKKVRSWRAKMLAARAKRVPPGKDDKVLTAWNGLMIASLAKGGRVLDEPRYTQAAARAAEFVLKHLRKDGRLLRTYRAGKSRLTAYLNDYAFFVEGLINLYEATFDRRWLEEARALTDTCIRYYYDEENGGFFFTASDGEQLAARSKNPRDGAIPSGNSVQAMNLLRLAVHLGRKDYREKAESIFGLLAGQARQSPATFERLLCAVDFYYDRVREIAIIGDPEAADTKALIRTVYARYLPNKVVAGAPDRVEDPDLPLLVGKRKMGGKATAYVCEQYRCKLPVTDPKALARLLDEPTPSGDKKGGSAGADKTGR
ncbi:MAG: thioredoxin domain-containing protein [Planctomycetota bacterium]|nr:MAG: thioredoxin domain-containing protein [Planctomycetota bacterium]